MTDATTKVPPPPPSGRGLVGDIRRARQGATASAEELREFVRGLRGRSPQEMLGVVAASDLVRSTILAIVITVVFMAVFTVGPYAWDRIYPPAAAPAVAAPGAAAAPSPATAPAGSASVAGVPPVGPPSGGAKPAGSTPADPLAPQGINDTKTADPKKNPLENTGDDLLKDLK